MSEYEHADNCHPCPACGTHCMHKCQCGVEPFSALQGETFQAGKTYRGDGSEVDPAMNSDRGVGKRIAPSTGFLGRAAK